MRSTLPCVALLALTLVGSVSAQAPDDPSPHSEARLVASVSSVAPGDSFDLALVIDVEEEWHVYWQNAGDSGQPLRVEWSLTEGATAGDVRYPVPEIYDVAGLTTFVHYGSPAFVTRIDVPDTASGSIAIEADARWLICADVCLQAEATAALTVPIGETAETGDLADAMAALPGDGDGWTASAIASGDEILLTVKPAGDVDLSDATFFPGENGVLDHSARPTFTAEGGAWAARLPVSAYASDTPDQLVGVLAWADGEAVEVNALVVAPAATAEAATAEAATDSGMGLLSAFGLALLGGLILNLMPCVFPVLGIKILGFVNGREAPDASLRAHGLAFGAGVVLSFLALAGVLLALRAGGDALGWGFQLQSPLVVSALAVLMVLLALNLFGVFSMGEGLAAAGGRLDRHDGLGGAFFSGVLATIVATPCTAPFMGAALGFAVAQPAPIALAIFASLGVGMAVPYVVLSFRPSLVRKLPRPGPWMETLRQILAFPLLATAVWLVWVFGLQVGIDGAAGLLLALVLVGLAAWTWGRWPSHASRRARVIARSFAVAITAGAVAIVVILTSSPTAAASGPASGGSGNWEAFDADQLEQLVANGQPVFIDFTATWCMTCQVNKGTTLNRPAVQDAFTSKGVTTVRADWTNEDPEITAALERFDRAGVPLYVLYPGSGQEPMLLPEVLTPQIVLDALDSVPTAVAES
ncbi:MAG: thioredoxin family protein [Bacteroidota bacterium]